MEEKLSKAGNLSAAILKEGVEREMGDDVRRKNIHVAVTISELLRKSLGPRGMSKLILDQRGDFVITSDGATILKEIEAEHPVARIVVEAAKVQDSVAGDGTITLVLVVGELLKRAEKLLNLGVHPNLIAAGFTKAAREAIKVLEHLAFEVKPEDEHILKSVAETAIGSKIGAPAKQHLAEIVVEAIKGIAIDVDNKVKVDLDNVKIVKQGGGYLSDTFLVDGVAVDREITHQDMPKHVENAKIALIQGALEVKEVKGKDLADVKLRITAPSQIRAFLDEETRIIKCMVEKIKASGANVVLINRGMDDLAIYYLARVRIPAWKRIFTSDMEKIARMTGGKPVGVDELNSEALGHAKVVEERKVGEQKFLLVREGKRRRASTIFIRGGTKHVAEDAERALHDSLCAVRDSIEDGKVIIGGGAAEIEISSHLKEFATKTGDREQLAIEAFAEAVEIIPKTLAENSGLNAIDILSALKAEHSKGNREVGVDALRRETGNMKVNMVFEPLRVKVQAIKSATEVATMILRIDDAFFAKRSNAEKPPEKPRPEEG